MRTIATPYLIAGAGAFMLAFAIKRHTKTPFDDAFERQGRLFHIDIDFLRALAKTENSTLNPRAVSPPNRNGTRDYGLMQINQRSAEKMGITDIDQLLDAEISIKMAAQWLDMIRDELGNYFSIHTWASAYNAGSDDVIRNKGGITNPAYVSRFMVHYQLYKLGKVA